MWKSVQDSVELFEQSGNDAVANPSKTAEHEGIGQQNNLVAIFDLRLVASIVKTTAFIAVVFAILQIRPTFVSGGIIEQPINVMRASSTEIYTDSKSEIPIRSEPRSIPVDPKLVLSPLFQAAVSQDTACSVIWGSYPNPETLPFWLSTPESPEELHTDIPYAYLAGMLIQNGVVSAGDCPGNGLLPSGLANPCGLEKARTIVTEWQNRFDTAIYQAAVNEQVPAQLLKKLFAQESQFWPGAASDGIHFGLGQTVEVGLDPLFMWDPTFFDEVCPMLFVPESCSSGFFKMPSRFQAMLRGYAILKYFDVTCPSCDSGIDIDKAINSIELYARLLIANCTQIDRLIFNQTGHISGEVTGYEDLWSFTIANYNVGAGCMSDAFELTGKRSEPISWGYLSRNLHGSCSIAVTYVDRIKN